MKRIFKKPYIFWIIGIFIFYLALNIIFSGFYQTIKLIIIYAKTVNWVELTLSVILSITIGILVSINSVYAFIKYRERKKCLEGKTLTGIGAIGGLVTGICPLCVTGLFPLIFSLFGVSFSLASLPFQGIEIQALVVMILLISLRMLSKNK